MPKSQDRLSLDEFLIPVGVGPGSGSVDPSSATVQFQFVVGGLPSRARPTEEAEPPTTTGWIDGFWITQQQGPLLAAILVGPGGAVTLPPGKYAAWIKVIDDPTIPVKAVDTLSIT